MGRPGDESDRVVLMLRDRENGETRKLTDAWDRSVGSIAWAADGKSLFVTAQDVLDHPVFRVDATSGKVERLKASNDATEGNIGSVTPLADGSLLYARNSVLLPTDVYVRAAKGKVAQLTNANHAPLAQLDPARVKQQKH